MTLLGALGSRLEERLKSVAWAQADLSAYDLTRTATRTLGDLRHVSKI